MKVNNCRSKWAPALNAKVMRGIERLVCDYRSTLPNGWRCCVEFQDNDEDQPNYQLDIESNKGGGDFAPVKMQTLHMFPKISATGYGCVTLPMMADVLSEVKECTDVFFTRLIKLHDVSELTDEDWAKLKECGITKWYGGIRIPYDILLTQPAKAGFEDNKQEVQQIQGEIRITFSGAKEWQDTFFCFRLFQKIQLILNELWPNDQIWYNLRGFKDERSLDFWVNALGVLEAPER